MLKFTTTGRFLSVTALAASTALSGPIAALAQDAEQPPAQIQDAPPEVVAPPAAETPPPETPAAPAAAPEPDVAPEPTPEPEAAPEPAPEPAPAAEPAPEAPAAEPEPTPPVEEPTPPSEQVPAAETQSAPDSGPPVDAPEGNPADLPTDEGTQNDLGEAPSGETAPAPEPTAPATAPAETAPANPAPALDAPPPASPAPAGEQAAPEPGETTPSPVPPAPPAPGAEPATPPVAPTDPAAPAAPSAAPTAPVDPTAPPVAPGAAPVVPGTPAAPAAPGAATPAEPATPSASPTTAPTPAAPAPGAPPATGTQAAPSPQAAAPQPAETPKPVAADIQTAPVPQGQIGQSDARVQNLAQPVEIRPVTAVEGQRIEAAPQVVLPPNVEVIEKVGDRDILSIVGAGVAGAAAGGLAAYFIRSNDDERLTRGSRDVTFEQLPRGLTRQTIVRPNGVQVVTIENEFGDVIQRSRIRPDGREEVLFYDPYAEDTQRPDYYVDAGADLPPLELEIPEDRYIVDVSEPDEELYYETIVAPPVETVERIYSLDEVRRSPRIRDKVRRIDLNTINFAFGSADVEQSEVENLQALADAIKRVIADNPSEVFLLEGHTDAVGSNVANLALSDRRAESVASALSEFFDIPSENIVTQGYGEEDLKVDTEAENRENRRVTLRRITPLVKPIVAAQAN